MEEPRPRFPLNARAVAAGLGISLSTLNGWLAADKARHPDNRLLSFHAYRGRKRVWSETAYLALERAVERESSPGGILGGWRTSSHLPPHRTAAEQALRRVLDFQPGCSSRGQRSEHPKSEANAP